MTIETIIADINWYEIVIMLISAASFVYGLIMKFSADEIKNINNGIKDAVNPESIKGKDISGSEALDILSRVVDALQTGEPNERT